MNSKTPDTDSTTEHRAKGGLESMITWAAAFCMGVGAAFLASLKQVNPSIEFHFTFATVAGFVLAAVFTIVCFRVILSRGTREADSRKRRRWLILFSLVASLAMLTSFAVSLRNLSPEKRSEVLSGTSIAVVVLAVFAWLFWKTVCFFDPEAGGQTREESTAREEDSP